mmetsp:Transcript_17144/g.43951  ORF Transcript_17144/g.43951 Transcript_17144/m.43951 type:complete len:242 (+) Transcript_17144:365-1090(+)
MRRMSRSTRRCSSCTERVLMNQSNRKSQALRTSSRNWSHCPYPRWCVMQTRKRSSSSEKSLPFCAPYRIFSACHEFLCRVTFVASAAPISTRRVMRCSPTSIRRTALSPLSICSCLRQNWEEYLDTSCSFLPSISSAILRSDVLPCNSHPRTNALKSLRVHSANPARSSSAFSSSSARVSPADSSGASSSSSFSLPLRAADFCSCAAVSFARSSSRRGTSNSWKSNHFCPFARACLGSEFI